MINIEPYHNIEPHKLLLKYPPDNQLLYKVFKWNHFETSVLENYLHLNRVDSYRDFEGADKFDGEQLPLDRSYHKNASFQNAPLFTLEDYYDTSRARTYACCFSTEFSDEMLRRYGNICVVFDFAKLRLMLNEIFRNLELESKIFSLNYGLIEYVDRGITVRKVANPIEYTYLKDINYQGEKEFRISLSPQRPGWPRVNGVIFNFSELSKRFPFNFKQAFEKKVIKEIIYCDSDIEKKLKKWEFVKCGYSAINQVS